jgi:hypothetical protein
MSFVRSALIAVAIAGIVMSGEGLAQTPAPEQSTSSKIKSKADDIAKWSVKEWNQAKAKWAKEKEKWAGCRKQSKDQGLAGRKSWSFLASCMTS